MTELEQDLRDILRERKPTPDERVAWAHTALQLVEQEPSFWRRWAPLWGFAAMTLIAFLSIWLTDGRLKHVDAVSERDANIACLRADDTIRRLQRTPKGHWAVIAKGKLHTAIRLRKVLEIEPKAEHRFVFRVDPEAPTPVDQVYVWKWTKPETAVAGRAYLAGASKDEIAAVDGQVWLKVDAEKAAVLKCRIDRSFEGGLLLPHGRTFPRAEIPGSVICASADGQTVHRRYLVRIHGRTVEAVAAPLDQPPPDWLPVKRAQEIATKSGRPLLVLQVTDEKDKKAFAADAQLAARFVLGWEKVKAFVLPDDMGRDVAGKPDVIVGLDVRHGGRSVGWAHWTEETKPSELAAFLSAALRETYPPETLGNATFHSFSRLSYARARRAKKKWILVVVHQPGRENDFMQFDTLLKGRKLDRFLLAHKTGSSPRFELHDADGHVHRILQLRNAERHLADLLDE